MDTILAQLSGDPLTNSAIIAVVALALLDFVTGTVRAISDGTFQIAALDVWVRKTLLGRVVTIILVLVFGRFVGTVTVGETTLAVLTGAGLAAAATFAAAALASIVANLNTNAPNAAPTE